MATDLEANTVSVSCLEAVTTAGFNKHLLEKLSYTFLLTTFFSSTLNEFFMAQNYR